MKKHLLGATAAALLAAGLALPAVAQNLAIVNGKPVSKTRMDTMLEQVKQQAERSGQALPPGIEEQLREEIITREVFMQEAMNRGLDKAPGFQAKMELARQSVLINELLAHEQQANPVTEADAKAEYERIVAAQAPAAGSKEFKARHILVESEDEAKALIAKIKGGASFEALAQAESKDPGSGAQGGDLGWASPASYVPEFSAAMEQLEKGQMSEAPVQSQFGFHIIQVDDVREAKAPEPPAFDDVKDQLMQQMGQQKMAQFQQELRSKAKVE